MVTVGRNPNTGEIEFFSDPRVAQARGYTDIQDARDMAGLNDEEEVVVDTGVDTISAGISDLENAEKIANDIIAEFLKNFEGSNIYGDDEDDEEEEPEFEETTQTYTPTKTDAAALYPYFPSNILDELIMKWTETGSIDIALATVRSGNAYAAAFPGIRREDGSLRMTEIQYLELKDSMKDQLRNYNLNPDIFADEIVEAIAGDVNIQEFSARLEFGYNELMNNKDLVLEIYKENHGLDLTEEALFAMFISPDISTAVLENDILVSQILAEAEIAGTTVGMTTAEKFVKADIAQRDAAQIFQRTEQLSGLTGVAAGAGFDLTEEDIATSIAGLSGQQLSLIKSIEARAASLSSIQAGAAKERTGEVVGLEEV